jgi:hypothetical protein
VPSDIEELILSARLVSADLSGFDDLMKLTVQNTRLGTPASAGITTLNLLNSPNFTTLIADHNGLVSLFLPPSTGSLTLNGNRFVSFSCAGLSNLVMLNLNANLVMTSLVLADSVLKLSSLIVSNCDLDGPAVDVVLVALASGVITNGTVDISGQIPDTGPGPDGTAAVAILVGRLWTVTTD